MILKKIDSPRDLKKLNLEELKEVAVEIRELIIETVSRKGGHLASSLGAVELCIALHYCLDTPKDSLIFDVGHQAYAHKILTGRRKLFSKLREYKGISGFPSSEESVYDVYISGHASTAISWAQGIAEAKRILKDNSKTVAVIGDGSLTGGMCFEALNNCGHSPLDILVIFNHNKMSITQSVGALSNYLNKFISLPVYNRIKKELEFFVEHLPPFAKKIAYKARRLEETLKGLIVPGIFFEEMGFRYFGPLDGHNLDVLIPTLKNVISLTGPRLMHIITQKGKGYKFAEEKPEEFHSVSPFFIENGRRKKPETESFGEVMAKKLISLARRDERIVAITAAMLKGTGLDLFKQVYPERTFDVGIAEAHAVGLASGLAKQGLKPVVAIYSTFLQRAYDQIIHDVALQKLGVVFIIDRAGLVGEDGPTHHGIFDINYLRAIPNFISMSPKDKEELQDMLTLSLSMDCPVSIRYPKGEAYSLGRREKVIVGKAQVLAEGKDLCIIALGSMVKEAMGVVTLLEKEGIECFLVNARFIKPLDKELFRFLGDNFKLIITLEEGILSGGFGSSILEFYQEENLLDKVTIKRIGIPDEFPTFAKREELLRLYKLDKDSIYQKIKDFIFTYNTLV